MGSNERCIQCINAEFPKPQHSSHSKMNEDGKDIEEQDGELELKSLPSGGSEKSASPSPSHSDGSQQSASRSRSRSKPKSKSKSRTRSLRGSRRHYSRSRSRHRSKCRSNSHSPLSDRRRHVGNRTNPQPNSCLGVFGLSLYTTERELREVFSKYGALDNINIVYDQQSRRSRGFAFIYFQNYEDSREAKEQANGMELDGRRIRVDFSITKRAHTPTPGIYMGRSTYGSSGSSRRSSLDYDRGCDRGQNRNYNRDYSRYDDRECRTYRRRYQSPQCYTRTYCSRSRSYSPRHY